MSDAESDNGLGDDLLAFMDGGAGEGDDKDNESEKHEDGEAAAAAAAAAEETKSASPAPAVAPSPSPPPKETPVVESAKSPPRRGVAQKLSRRGAAARRRARQEFEPDSEDEGEASDASANTLGSGAMSESDSDDEGPAETGPSDVLFPYENKFYDADDKRQIMNMPEIQREAILAERALQIERHGQKAELRRLFQNRAQEETKAEKKKRKASAADLDDGQRKSSRPKTKASDTLEEYKRQREERRLGVDRRHSSSGSEVVSDADADGDDDVEWDDGFRSSGPKTSPVGSLKSFNRARIARTGFAQCCFWPDFEEAVLGCYVRLLTRTEDAQQVYRMVRIKGFTEGRPYEMEWNNRRFMTDQYMIVSYGKETQEKEFVCASESPFTDQEFDRYKRICEAHNVKLPTEAELADRVGGIHHMLSRKWTDQDINDKIARQNKYKDRVDSKMKAIQANREAEKATSGPSQNERLAQLNAANRKANAEAVRRAQILEKKKRLAFQQKKRQEDAEARAAFESEAAKAKDDGLDDLFGDTKSRSATPGGVETPKEKKKPIIATPRSNGIGGFKTLKTKTADEEAFEQLDLGIDIEI